MSTLASQLLPAALLESLAKAPETWLVGGALRDHFLQRPQPDRDFAVAGEAIDTARRVADRLGGHFYILDPVRDAGRVILEHDRTLDFVRLRGASIEQDLQLRDFTINALASALHGESELVDPLGGLQDLRDRRLMTCSPAAIGDDPVRALRGARLAHELRLQIPSETAGRIQQAAPGLAGASAERVRDELVRMLDRRTSGGLRLADQLGCLAPVLPEAAADRQTIQAGLDVASRLNDLLAALDREPGAENFAAAQIGIALGRYRDRLGKRLSQRLSGGRTVTQILYLAALHAQLDHGEAAVFNRSRALHFSRIEAQRARTIVAHASPERVFSRASRLERHRYFRTAGEAGVEAVLLSLAVWLGAAHGPPGQEQWERQTQVARELLAVGLSEADSPPRLLDGDQLMDALGIEPGPQVGRLLERIREAQIEGRVESAEQAIELARGLMAQG